MMLNKLDLEEIWNNQPHGYLRSKGLIGSRRGKHATKFKIRVIPKVVYKLPPKDYEVLALGRDIAINEAYKLARKDFETSEQKDGATFSYEAWVIS